MHPALTEALTRLDRSRAGLRAAVDAVPDGLRNDPIDAGRWSVAGIVEHIALLDERFIGLIGTKIAEARTVDSGAEVEEPALLPGTVASMLADRSERRQAPEALHPTGITCDAAWERAEATRAAFRQLLTDAEDMALSRVIHSHPRFGNLSVYQWADFLAAHEGRHAEQIRELATELDARR